MKLTKKFNENLNINAKEKIIKYLFYNIFFLNNFNFDRGIAS
jgi:hypothetical protein